VPYYHSSITWLFFQQSGSPQSCVLILEHIFFTLSFMTLISTCSSINPCTVHILFGILFKYLIHIHIYYLSLTSSLSSTFLQRYDLHLHNIHYRILNKNNQMKLASDNVSMNLLPLGQSSQDLVCR